jgi:hypothetical protein
MQDIKQQCYVLDLTITNSNRTIPDPTEIHYLRLKKI